ncbi:hypothetical protein F511_24266 [Dorcoceras hygrometricum]|uniref:Uncharacterized protein n=1 Tax=Dorcoceras hygrometricum TaxID=472368 RepID=A0A2Z7ATT4_9LAMI|nr:hypothetical protein F511_24266 [Dorcoceras hygrometricum]
MAQYHILARKLLGPPETGPKQTLEVKNSVATPPRVRRTAAARRRPPPAQCAAHCRAQRLRTGAATCARTARRLAAGAARHPSRQSRTVAGHRHCSCAQLQFHRAHATVPP